MCGKLFPSRPHLVWKCPQVCDLRSTCEPSNRVEERLFTKACHECPRPASQFSPDHLHNAVARMLVPVFRSEPHVVIATDGSADLGLASFAIHLPQVECSLNCDVLSEEVTLSC